MQSNKHKGVVSVLLCGAVSSACGQTVSYPFQLVRTKLQAQGMPGKANYKKYDGFTDCFVKIVRNRGVMGLYRGICANYMKAIPAISIKYMSTCFPLSVLPF